MMKIGTVEKARTPKMSGNKTTSRMNVWHMGEGHKMSVTECFSGLFSQ